MRELVTDAIVLDKEPVREFDARVSLFTKELGRVTAVVTSARKIISKLSPHVEPLMVSEVRLTEKGGMHLTDALQKKSLPHAAFPILNIIKKLSEPYAADGELWASLTSDGATAKEALRILGFDPTFARCDHCLREKPEFFVFEGSAYFCDRCIPYHLDRDQYVRV